MKYVMFAVCAVIWLMILALGSFEVYTAKSIYGSLGAIFGTIGVATVFGLIFQSLFWLFSWPDETGPISYPIPTKTMVGGEELEFRVR